MPQKVAHTILREKNTPEIPQDLEEIVLLNRISILRQEYTSQC